MFYAVACRTVNTQRHLPKTHCRNQSFKVKPICTSCRKASGSGGLWWHMFGDQHRNGGGPVGTLWGGICPWAAFDMGPGASHRRNAVRSGFCTFTHLDHHNAFDTTYEMCEFADVVKVTCLPVGAWYCITRYRAEN